MSTNEERSAIARKRGNDLVRKGLFTEATKAYFESLKLTPDDHTPLANLAAMKFELGNYPGSVTYTQKALRLFDHEDDGSPKKQKLLLRLAKSHVLSLQRKETQDVVGMLAPGAERDSLEESFSITVAQHAKPSLQQKSLNDFRDTGLFYEPEYYPVGHDTAFPQYENRVMNIPDERLSWLFAGIGDARHSIPFLHFTLLDLKPAALARDLLFFELLSDPTAQDTNSETMACVIYVYSSQIMPQFAYDRM
ncbi:Uu.00g011510.m01.CDS01 [Anthostomella pinea]|uniref:Uu.00g011510.m01.CDS01 n=1 Tax=Anthostomella pinea TaxID=933095 RepID=A0AAI8VXT6_9PEZI|nr:Uu.00g011510.m01.CDS01 [Anthostomella pinea]